MRELLVNLGQYQSPASRSPVDVASNVLDTTFNISIGARIDRGFDVALSVPGSTIADSPFQFARNELIETNARPFALRLLDQNLVLVRRCSKAYTPTPQKLKEKHEPAQHCSRPTLVTPPLDACCESIFDRSSFQPWVSGNFGHSGSAPEILILLRSNIRVTQRVFLFMAPMDDREHAGTKTASRM